MKNFKSIFYLLILSLGISLFASCAVEVSPALPGPALMIPSNPPFVGAVWIGGGYRWDRYQHRYVVVEGHWSRPRAGRSWSNGGWYRVRGGYAWRNGHWK